MKSVITLVMPPAIVVLALFAYDHTVFLQHNQIQYVWYAAGVIGFLSLAAVAFYHLMGNHAKKIMFYLTAFVIIGFTAFLNVSLLYQNYVSPFHGPVHWHADVTFDICGKEYRIASHDIATDKPLHTHRE